MSADPLAVHVPDDEADLNLYAYVHGQALKEVDPLGLCEQGAGGSCPGEGGSRGAPSSQPSERNDPYQQGIEAGRHNWRIDQAAEELRSQAVMERVTEAHAANREVDQKAIAADLKAIQAWQDANRASVPREGRAKEGYDAGYKFEPIKEGVTELAIAFLGRGGRGGAKAAPGRVPRVTREMRLRQLADDPNVSSADRGWIRNEVRQVDAGSRKSTTVRVPPGKELRHPPGKANAQGNDYAATQLQDAATHRSQHRYLVERKTGTTVRRPKTPPTPGPKLPE